MSHLSRTDSEGFPGDVLAQVNYTWTDDSELRINIRATSTMPTPINITNYCLFNLAGHVRFQCRVSRLRTRDGDVFKNLRKKLGTYIFQLTFSRFRYFADSKIINIKLF